MKKDVTSLRGALEFLEERGELLTITKEVDPILEIAGIQKATDNGATVLFENIKGYPGVRDAGNVTGNAKTVAAMFGLNSKKELRFRCLEAIKKPLPPKMVSNPPCQEVVITKDIDILNIELQSGNFEYSEEVVEGVIVDISKEGEILGIEIIDAKRRLGGGVANKIAKKYAAAIRI